MKIINTAERLLTRNTTFNMLVLIQALFGSISIIQQPQRLVDWLDSSAVRLFFLILLAFSATKDLRLTAASVISFLLVMWYIRTPEERESHGII